MRHPMNYLGTYPTNWAGYTFKASLGTNAGRHTGVDYNHGIDDLGDPCYAIASGKVVGIKPNGAIGGFGNALIIQTDACPPGTAGNKMFHRYLHLNSISVSVGQTVSQGQQIGAVGKTGTGAAHLHLDVWTDRNGLGVHWNYDKYTQLASYEDGFWLIENNKTWDGNSQGDIMDSDDKIKRQYMTLRGSEGTAAERRAWLGKPYDQFNVTAVPEINARETHKRNLEAAVKTLASERDTARNELAKANAELLKVQDEVRLLQARNLELTAENGGLKQSLATLEASHQKEVDELNKTIDDRNKQIADLEKQLDECSAFNPDDLNIVGKFCWVIINKIGRN